MMPRSQDNIAADIGWSILKDEFATDDQIRMGCQILINHAKDHRADTARDILVLMGDPANV